MDKKRFQLLVAFEAIQHFIRRALFFPLEDQQTHMENSLYWPLCFILLIFCFMGWPVFTLLGIWLAIVGPLVTLLTIGAMLVYCNSIKIPKEASLKQEINGYGVISIPANTKMITMISHLVRQQQQE
jgi:hypothetical protein